MAKTMLIDAAHPEETRVVVMDGSRVDDFDFETQSRRQLRGNIYLAKVTRVEPSLQAAFVEYGGNRHGFLAFPEIHPDYYQIPVADREALKAEFEAAEAEAAEQSENGEGEEEDDNALEEMRRRILSRRYKIQEVIRRRQVMLVQVVKEERGNKGAALTSYLSLAGRYCVLMPNTARGGGISRKITNAADRKRLKKVAADLEVPRGMGLIIRTAGAKRTKTEIKRDYEYLLRAWETIRDTTMRSIAPALIYEESSLVKRAIRDLYDKDVDEVHVEGDAAYREAKDFVRMLMPSHAKRVHLWKEPTPILAKSGAERQLSSAFSPVVNLRSGGYIVINQTEALVAIDVNSGRATRERNIEATAVKTNLEATEEAARQIRLRDLAGLIVIDFIDMEESKNDRAVEKRMKDCLRFDRARVQMGKISPFGLLEISRQRRRTGILEGTSHLCSHCGGSGRIRSVESSALTLLRAIEETAGKAGAAALEVRAPTEVALYILNDKRSWLDALEQKRSVRIRVAAAPGLTPPDFEIATQGQRRDEDLEEEVRAVPPQREPQVAAALPMDLEEEAEEEAPDAAPGASEAGEGRSRRRRGRRGGRRAKESVRTQDAAGEELEPADARADAAEARAPRAEGSGASRRRRRPRGRLRTGLELDGGEHFDFIATDPLVLALAPSQQALLPPEPAPEFDAAPEPALTPVPAGEARADAEQTPTPPPRRRARSPSRAQEEPPPASMAPAPAEDQPPEEPLSPDAQAPQANSAGEATALPSQTEPQEYQPDQERRERFLARLSRWAKKDM